jgi:hypothetical protein
MRLVALPVEHGGWGLLLEPIALGIAVAPTAAGTLLGLAALGAFLARHPLKIALADRRRSVRYPRTVWAERFAQLYGLVAVVAFVAALRLASAAVWAALLVAAPLVLVQFGSDLRNQQRKLWPELAGASALAAMAPAIVLAGGWGPAPAFALWVALVARAAPAIMYVRVRLRRMRGVAVSSGPVILAHVTGVLAVVGLAVGRLAPATAVVALAILLGRAVYGLSPGRPSVPPVVIGKQELAFGVLTIALLAAGYLV